MWINSNNYQGFCGESRFLCHLGETRYSVHMDKVSGVLYFFDVSGEYEATVELVTSRPVIGIVSVDNYDDLEDETSESDISHINSFVANFVSEFAGSMPCSPVE